MFGDLSGVECCIVFGHDLELLLTCSCCTLCPSSLLLEMLKQGKHKS